MPILGSPPSVVSDTTTYPPGHRFGPTLVTTGNVVWGMSDADGTEWHVADLQGWDDTPEVVSQSSQRVSAHGLNIGPQTYTGRSLTLTGWIVARSTELRRDALRQLHGSLPVNSLAVVRVSDTPERYVRARINGQLKAARIGTCCYAIQIPLLAPDPRRYYLNPDPVTVTLPTAALGVSLPASLPLAFPERTDSADRPVTNYGDMDCPWTARIVGPITQPSIEAPDLGREVTVNLTLGATDTLDLDSRDRTVILNGSASRSGLVTRASSWFDIPADSTTTIRLGSAAVPDGATPTLTFTALSADA